MNELRNSVRKVPEITIFFWIVKILTTAMGESTSDYLVHIMNPVVAVALGAVAFVIALGLQFRSRRYTSWIYWLTVTMVAIFGTMAADVMHIALGVSYLNSVILFSVILVCVFALWYGIEHTLSIHSISTTRRELFYWATVMTTFALGTATGDLTASTLGLGYLASGILFVVLIAIVAGGYYIAKSRNAVLTFWLAYILTRPLGASFADWMGKASAFGGLGWGDGWVSAVLTILIIGFVIYLTVTHTDTHVQHL